jgi:hypothetical protein
MLALGKSSYLILSEAIMHTVHVLLIFVGLQVFGVVGVAYAFVLLYVLHVFVTLFIAKNLIYFSWTRRSKATIFLASTASLLLFLSSLQLNQSNATLVGSAATIVSLITSTFFIIKRTEADDRFPLIKKASRFFLAP